MLRLLYHIFKKYRIISYYSDTAYVAVVHDSYWKAISRNIICNETKYKYNYFYDKSRYEFRKSSKLDFEWYVGQKLLTSPCHSWVESHCMVDSIEKAENMIRLHKKNKKIQ